MLNISLMILIVVQIIIVYSLFMILRAFDYVERSVDRLGEDDSHKLVASPGTEAHGGDCERRGC